MKILKEKFFEEITLFGGALFYVFVIFLAHLIGEKNYAFKLLIGLFAIYFVAFIIRLVYFKERPKKVKHSNLLERLDASSFPSVHSARIIFLSISFIMLYSKDLVVVSLLFLLNLAVVYSRIYLLKHDLIDVIGGILLGIACAIIII
ncbi:MAG: phosphatase PAP2 family protein [Nanoarchaeota archaeon]